MGRDFGQPMVALRLILANGKVARFGAMVSTIRRICQFIKGFLRILSNMGTGPRSLLMVTNFREIILMDFQMAWEHILGSVD